MSGERARVNLNTPASTCNQSGASSNYETVLNASCASGRVSVHEHFTHKPLYGADFSTMPLPVENKTKKATQSDPLLTIQARRKGQRQRKVLKYSAHPSSILATSPPLQKLTGVFARFIGAPTEIGARSRKKIARTSFNSTAAPIGARQNRAAAAAALGCETTGAGRKWRRGAACRTRVHRVHASVVCTVVYGEERRKSRLNDGVLLARRNGP